MKTFRLSLLLACALSLSGCATVPFSRGERVPTKESAPRELVEGHWIHGGGTHRMRLTVRFAQIGFAYTLEGFMILDLDASTLRVAAMDILGLKIFDISAGSGGIVEHYAVEGLKKRIDLPKLAGEGFERIFLGPGPAANDSFTRREYDYRLARSLPEGDLVSLFGGAGAVMTEKRLSSPAEEWRVRYYLHRSLGGYLIPGGIVYDNATNGFRMTLWMEGGK